MIVLENETHVHSFNSLDKIDIIETSSNPTGICSMCSSKNACALALPDKTTGSVLIKFYGDSAPRASTIKAHKKAITTIALNEEGTLLATASAKVL
jgi:WD repeat-containing protein 45